MCLSPNIGNAMYELQIMKADPMAAMLAAGDSGPTGDQVMCVYCEQSTSVTNVATRREVLRKTGRFYISLKNHLSRDCCSKLGCGSCQGRHHVTICSHNVCSKYQFPTPSSMHTLQVIAISSGRSSPQQPTLSTLVHKIPSYSRQRK